MHSCSCNLEPLKWKFGLNIPWMETPVVFVQKENPRWLPPHDLILPRFLYGIMNKCFLLETTNMIIETKLYMNCP